MELGAGASQQILNLRRRKRGGELGDGLDEGEGLDPLVRGILSRKKLEHRTGLVADRLVVGTGV